MRRPPECDVKIRSAVTAIRTPGHDGSLSCPRGSAAALFEVRAQRTNPRRYRNLLLACPRPDSSEGELLRLASFSDTSSLPTAFPGYGIECRVAG